MCTGNGMLNDAYCTEVLFIVVALVCFTELVCFDVAVISFTELLNFCGPYLQPLATKEAVSILMHNKKGRTCVQAIYNSF